ncbi:MAG: MFS transporter [Chloroflexi bacterium]|nr:MFS transporter [Chloroflexota bacterium]
MIAPASPAATDSWMHRLPFFYGWVVLAAGGMGMFFSGPGQTYVVSIFVDPMLNDLGWSRTLYAGLYTGGTITAATLVPVVGKMLDRYGGRVMLVAVSLIFGVAIQLMRFVDEPLQLFFGFLAIRALGQGSLGLISTTLAAMWFVRMRGRAMAFMALASPASQAAFPMLTFFLIAAVGWRSAWGVLGLIVWIALVPTGVFLVRRSPEAIGMLPDGDRRTAEGASDRPGDSRSQDWTLGEAVRTRSFWLLLIAGSSLSMISTALAFHHISLMVSKGLGAGMAAGVLSFTAPIALVGTFLGGFLADKLPNRFLLAAGQVGLLMTMLWVLNVSEAWEAFAYGGIMGLTQGTIMTVTNVIWPNYFGRAHIGSIRGVASSAMVASSALGPLPFGFIFDRTGDYNVAILAFLGLPIACAALSLLARPPVKRLVAAGR